MGILEMPKITMHCRAGDAGKVRDWVVHRLCITAWKESGSRMIHNLGTQYKGSPGLNGAQLVDHCGSSPFSRPAMCDTHVAVGGCGSSGIVHDTKRRRLIGWRMRWLEEEVTVILELSDRLPIQQRRTLGIPRDERICTVCDSGEVGDEFHYLLNCSNENVKRNRIKYVDKYYTHHPNVPKFCSLMNMTSKYKNIKLAKFISCILQLFWLSQ